MPSVPDLLMSYCACVWSTWTVSFRFFCFDQQCARKGNDSKWVWHHRDVNICCEMQHNSSRGSIFCSSVLRQLERRTYHRGTINRGKKKQFYRKGAWNRGSWMTILHPETASDLPTVRQLMNSAFINCKAPLWMLFLLMCAFSCCFRSYSKIIFGLTRAPKRKISYEEEASRCLKQRRWQKEERKERWGWMERHAGTNRGCVWPHQGWAQLLRWEGHHNTATAGSRKGWWLGQWWSGRLVMLHSLFFHCLSAHCSPTNRHSQLSCSFS